MTVVAFAVFAVYVLVFPLVWHVAGSGAISLGFVPVIVLAWRYGLWMGAIAGFTVNVAHLMLLALVGDGFLYVRDMPLLEWLIPAASAVVFGAFVGYVRDLRAALQVKHEALLRTSRRDGLTDLLNRSTLKTRLDEALLRGGPQALLYVDLDGFKHLNDAYGHATVDTPRIRPFP